jgi:hypothetical protein
MEEECRMFRLVKYYYILRNRPYGTITVVAYLGMLVALCSLAAGFVFKPFNPYGTAIAIGYAVLLLTLLVSLIAKLQAKLNDIQYSSSLENGLRRACYELEDFFTDEAAANPSLQLMHFKILRFCQPKETLELGSGQTTKLLSCYKQQNPSAYVLTLEQNELWFRQLGAKIAHDYRHVELERKEFTCAGTGLHLITNWYKEQPEFHSRRFNYVLIDGPDPGGIGTDHVDYSRCGILEYMPGILAPSFIIVFDDAERYGEMMTINALAAILHAKGVKFVQFARYGIKTQVVLCSADLRFLQSI